MEYGKSLTSGLEVRASDLKRDYGAARSQQIICPACSRPLLLKHGMIRAPHFAHHRGEGDQACYEYQAQRAAREPPYRPLPRGQSLEKFYARFEEIVLSSESAEVQKRLREQIDWMDARPTFRELIGTNRERALIHQEELWARLLVEAQQEHREPTQQDLDTHDIITFLCSKTGASLRLYRRMVSCGLFDSANTRLSHLAEHKEQIEKVLEVLLHASALELKRWFGQLNPHDRPEAGRAVASSCTLSIYYVATRFIRNVQALLPGESK